MSLMASPAGAGPYCRIAASSDSPDTYGAATYGTKSSTPAATGAVTLGASKSRPASLSELGRQGRGLLGRDIEGEGLDGDEAVLIGVVRTKDRPQHARPNLVQEFEPTESRRRRVRGA